TLGQVVRIVLFSVLLFVLSWRLGLDALAVTPLFALAARTFARRIKDATSEARVHSGEMSAVAEESLSNAPLVQAYQRQDAEVERYESEARLRVGARLRAARLTGGFSPLVRGVEMIGLLAVIGLGTWQIGQGELTVG